MVDVVAVEHESIGLSDSLPRLEELWLVDHLVPDIVRAQVDHVVRLVVVSTVLSGQRDSGVVRDDRLLRVPISTLEVSLNAELLRCGAFQLNTGICSCRILRELVGRVGAVPGVAKLAGDFAPGGDLLLLDLRIRSDFVLGLRAVSKAQQEDAGEEETREDEEEDDRKFDRLSQLFGHKC